MCCLGCQAVAQAIVDNKLTDYYHRRDALPESRREAAPEALRELALFDNPEFQKSFVRQAGDGSDVAAERQREAALIFEGISCAACAWLNETYLARQPGVLSVDINYATRRARVRWDERRIRLSQILAAVAAIGYRAYPYDVARSEQLAQDEQRAALWRLFVAGFGMMQVMMYAVPAYLAGAGEMSDDIAQLMRWTSLVLTIPVAGYAALPFFRNAWRDLKLMRAGMDVPVSLGVGSAFAASLWATLSGEGEVYFDSVTMFVFFLLCGRYLEMLARQAAVRGTEEIARLLPAFCTRLLRYPLTASERIAVAALVAGDVVQVQPGEVIPADGVVIEGESSAEEALLTGESQPVAKQPGVAVIGGSINRASPLVLRVEKTGEATRLAAIRRLMERAATEKPRIVRLADRAASWFVAALLVLAVVTAYAWLRIDPDRALWIFFSVLVVSCPCALSLATPMALATATGALSKIGLLATRGHAIETLARATHFVFDKTGTLTHGRLRLKQTIVLGDVDADQALRLAAALEQGSEHAIGKSLGRSLHASFATEEMLPAFKEVKAYTGQGVEGRFNDRPHRIGRIEFVQSLHGRSLPQQVQADADGDTWVALGDEQGWLALFSFSDSIRPQARSLIAALRADGCAVTLLSGDTPAAVAEVARRLGITDAHGGLSPQDKHEFISRLQESGAIVAMIGDGVNDAPVLARAQVSIAMGSGTELARAQGDFILMTDDIGQIAQGVALCRRTLAIIRQNLIWAAIYNLSAVPLAMFGYVTPWMAGIGMSASSLLVVLNALRLQKVSKVKRTVAALQAA